jgi:hypothetical protein
MSEELTSSEKRLIDRIVASGSHDPDAFDAQKSIDRTTEELAEESFGDLNEQGTVGTSEDVMDESDLEPESVHQTDLQYVQFHTEEDDRVCPICEFFEREEFELDDDGRPQIPLHPNCRCWWEHVATGETLTEADIADIDIT